MSKREEALELLELLEPTSGCDKISRRIIREEWDIEIMREALDLLIKLYQGLKEKYEAPPRDGSYDFEMIKLLSDRLFAVEQWRWRLNYDAITKEFLPQIKEDLVWIIVNHYRFISKSIKEYKEAIMRRQQHDGYKA